MKPSSIFLFLILALPAFAQDDPAPETVEQEAAPTPPRIIDTPTGSHPKALIQRLDTESGTVFYRWLDANGAPVDSGNSIARFTPNAPDGETGEIAPDVDDAVLLAAIIAPEPATALRQTVETVLLRMTAAERVALLTSQNADVLTFLEIARGRGVIRSDNPDAIAAITLLDALNIVAAERWPTLLGP